MSVLYSIVLAIYIILLNPILYCWWRHGRRGFLGWLCFQSFCVVRIVGSALYLHDEATNTTSTVTLIFNSLGLAPLTIRVLGILHEAGLARNSNIQRKLEWALVLGFHTIVVAATVVIIIGIVKLESGSTHESDKNPVKAGAAVFVFCWALLIVWALFSLKRHYKDVDAYAYADGTKLLYAVILALAFLGFREAYIIGIGFYPDSDFPTLQSIKIGLSIVPEAVVIIFFAVVGIWTRNIPKDRRRDLVSGS